ncbi:hypothetical protein CMEL01_12941 [Colletotrichum melonis]|uniref:Uncharacterized protein n=1 Tax=Colletotrichum melonis TaxID=1209925 RepID=A0AAI9UVF0_9PEZI|nr:hypothetical protein CMEL01_12941 [Colletotrichum melonis]
MYHEEVLNLAFSTCCMFDIDTFFHQSRGTRFNMRFAAIVTTLALLTGFAAAAPAVPGNAVEPRQTRDGFYCQECVNGKKDCVACTDGTCLGWTYDC